MYIYGGTKTNQDNICIGFSPCLNSQKQNIWGTHNYVVAEKSPSYFPQNRWEGNIEEGRFNTQ